MRTLCLIIFATIHCSVVHILYTFSLCLLLTWSLQLSRGNGRMDDFGGSPVRRRGTVILGRHVAVRFGRLLWTAAGPPCVSAGARGEGAAMPVLADRSTDHGDRGGRAVLPSAEDRGGEAAAGAVLLSVEELCCCPRGSCAADRRGSAAERPQPEERCCCLRRSCAAGRGGSAVE